MREWFIIFNTFITITLNSILLNDISLKQTYMKEWLPNFMTREVLGEDGCLLGCSAV
jgi:hypothetical protein